MLVFKPCENFLLLPPKFLTSTTTTTTISKPHHHHHHHHHHYHDVKLHFPPLKAHFKSTLCSSSSPLSSSSSSSSAEAAEEEEEEEEEEDSSLLTTRDFLMDSGGLSYVQAIQVIRQVPTLLNKGGRKPKSVIAYFESSIGFSKTHISKAISKYPGVLVADVEKTLKPKIQMFLDFGFSKSDIADLIASNPRILTVGLKTHLKPGLDLIKSFVKTDEDLIKTIKRSGLFLLGSSSCRKSIEPNIDVLRQHGVPDSEIQYLIVSNLQTLMSTPKVFKSSVERIVSLGFKPETKMFVTAVGSMSRMKKAKWDSKMDLLKGLGWSDEQILDSFRRCPTFLRLSRENLEESIEFFKESLNWDASVLSQRAVVLHYSLKRRVIPRYAVLKCLMSKEIIKEDTIFVNMLNLNETDFLSKYVFKYQDQLPYLYEVYKKECMMGCEEDNGEISNQQDHGDVDMTV